MVSAERNRSSGKGVQDQNRCRAMSRHGLEKMELEAEQIPGRNRGHNDGIECGHGNDGTCSRLRPASDRAHTSMASETKTFSHREKVARRAPDEGHRIHNE